MTDEREMTLDEWCAKLPDFCAVNRELRALRQKESHPLAGFWRQVRFKIRHWR